MPRMAWKNTLYYGDNLDVLERYVKDGTVDLVYLDPPFNSDQNYNVLFAEQSGERAAAQIKAFEDTWRWDEAAAAAYELVVERGDKVSDALRAFRTFLGESDMLAYLSMMAPRLTELRSALKETGSLYLHCDPAASHYLKQLLDAVFGPAMFRNEVIWKRTHAHGGAHRYGPVHDVLLFYTRSDSYTWNPQFTPYTESYLESFFRFRDPDGRRYRATILTGSGTRGGASGQPWRTTDPTEAGRHWAIPGYMREFFGDPPPNTPQEALDRLDDMERILWPDKAGGVPSFKQYQDDMPGVPLQDVWTDIPPISSQAKERLGYPTQKPEALLERIIRSSSNEGDLVLDPFCGCGTAVAVAERLNRRWVGIDITHLAVTLMKHRLLTRFGETVEERYEVVGEPVSLPDAEALAAEDPYQFQWWSLGLVGARPVEQKKGADRGIDGRLFFHDEKTGGKTKQVIFSVKAGKTSSAHVNELRGVIEREGAEIGVLISLQAPTKNMRAEAASAGMYKSVGPGWKKDYPRLQLITVAELLEGKTIQLPTGERLTFKAAERAREQIETETLPFE
jgi:DNA modification methylase